MATAVKEPTFVLGVSGKLLCKTNRVFATAFVDHPKSWLVKMLN